MESQIYVLNSLDDESPESMFIADRINITVRPNMKNRFFDSADLLSPSTNIAIPADRHKQDSEIKKFGKNINQNLLTSPESSTGVKSNQCIVENQTMPVKNNSNPRYLSPTDNLPTGTLPEYATKYSPNSTKIDGPRMKPNKLPTAEEGESGTVQGLANTKINPTTSKINPFVLLFLDFFDCEIHRLTGINASGSQNRKAACNISSMTAGM